MKESVMNKLLLGSLASCLFALGALACTSSSSGAPDAKLQGNGQGPDVSPRSCQTNDDCVVVETQCCDHCNGGKADAFNKKFAEAEKPKDCAATMCTEMGCGAAVAECIDSNCKVKIQPLVAP